MKQICHLDIETFSESDLKAEGLYKYAASPTTEVLCVCYAFGDGPVHLWVPRAEPLPDGIIATLRGGLPTSMPMDLAARVHIGANVPVDLGKWIVEGMPVAAHNAAFERTVLNGPAGFKLGFPTLTIEQMICTAAKASAHGMPRALEFVTKALGGAQKNETGKNAMRALCKPRTGAEKRWTLETAPDKYAEMYLYCVDDVKAERSVDDQIPDLLPSEMALWELDQKMNDRGIPIDIPKVNDAIDLLGKLRAEVNGECFHLTGVNATQTAKLADWIRGQGYCLKDLTAPVMAAAIADKDCPERVRTVLRLRAMSAMKAPDKYFAMALAAGEDDRLRGMFIFHGAGTGRWSSSIVQLQNLFRPLISDPHVAIEAFAARDPEWLRMLYPDVSPMTVLASCVRSVIAAAQGRELLCMDYSQIEARIVAWLAGQIDVLKIFASEQDIYAHTAAMMFNLPVESISKGDYERFLGKIAVLALGYQGGTGAFESMAKLQGVDVGMEKALEVVTAWREANPKTVQLWYDLERCMINAISKPGAAYGLQNGLIKFKVIGRWLYILLPSGRRMAYFEPALDDQGKPSYMGMDTYTRQWCRVTTYGGRILQNIAEGIARDLLASALFRLEDADYNPLGSVHDEAITEPAIGHGSLDEAMKIFQDAPAWANGLPVAAAGWRGKRYRK